VVVAHFRCESKVGAQERGSQLSHQFLAGVLGTAFRYRDDLVVTKIDSEVTDLKIPL
jgi:hypothetical protein